MSAWLDHKELSTSTYRGHVCFLCYRSHVEQQMSAWLDHMKENDL